MSHNGSTDKKQKRPSALHDPNHHFPADHHAHLPDSAKPSTAHPDHCTTPVRKLPSVHDPNSLDEWEHVKHAHIDDTVPEPHGLVQRELTPPSAARSRDDDDTDVDAQPHSALHDPSHHFPPNHHAHLPKSAHPSNAHPDHCTTPVRKLPSVHDPISLDEWDHVKHAHIDDTVPEPHGLVQREPTPPRSASKQGGDDDDGAEASALALETPAPGQQRSVAVYPTGFAYFTKRYFSQYLAKNVKGIEGNNLRFMLHSNGLCVICLDPSHVAIQRELELRKANNGQRRLCLTKVDFETSRKVDRRDQIDKIKGKAKKGAAFLEMHATVCTVQCKVEAFPEIKAEAEAAEERLAVVGQKRRREENEDGNDDGQAAQTASSSNETRKNPRFGRRGRLALGIVDFKVPAMINCVLLEVNAKLFDDPELLVDRPLTDGYVAVVNPKREASFENTFELLSVGQFAAADSAGLGMTDE